MRNDVYSKIYKISFGALLGAFLVIRLYVANSWTLISMDEATYLGLARHFPNHILYNLSFYVTHPPFYPYMIHAIQYLLPNLTGGIGVSVICAGISFFLLNRLFYLMNKPPSWRLSALSLFTLSLIHITYSNMIMKESATFCLFLAGLTCAMRYFLGGPIRWAFLSGLSGLALTGTSHEHGFIFILIQGIGWLFFRKKDFRGLLAMITFPLLSWSGWLALRVYPIIAKLSCKRIKPLRNKQSPTQLFRPDSPVSV